MATKKISELGAAASVTSAALFETVISGVNVKATATQIATRMALDITGLSSDAVDVPIIAGAMYATLTEALTVNHSTGWIEDSGITDDADGTITVAAGSGAIRATNSDVAELLQVTWGAESGANVNLADNDISYIYVEYNGGTPQVVADTTKRTDHHTNIWIGTVHRTGTTLHIVVVDRVKIVAHASHMHNRMVETLPFAHVSGGAISETGTRNFALTAGSWWQGLNKFNTAEFDSDPGGDADTFSYWYDNGSGFTEVTAQAAIDNLQYNTGGALATLSNSKYGVHWVYLSTDSGVSVLYGTVNGTLDDANNADAPAALPDRLQIGTRLIGKIIIQKSASTFTSIENTFTNGIETASPTDHENLVNLLGGSAGEHYHMTSAQHAANAYLNVAQEWTTTQNFNATVLTSTGNAMAWDAAANQVAKHTLTEDTTVAAPSNLKDGATYILTITQHASSAKTVAYNAVFKWAGGTAPTMSTGNDAVDVMTFVSDGTNLYGSFLQDFS